MAYLHIFNKITLSPSTNVCEKFNNQIKAGWTSEDAFKIGRFIVNLCKINSGKCNVTNL
jgi:hypothetical protein